ncbi:nucleoside deaminase [Lyngbya confervoides]|uniref:Nucleoside deaminase n=1 Tax=Lyngbya confervoides BDU141951 TaxID=1574623 RepID=A0ABD4T0L6_9CYAN|nr:nucleoside deaminase [Lyngbya confervoides]MCM1981837.1 nucleoside deaminase [Lyngbya confervoides BDU141951]
MIQSHLLISLPDWLSSWADQYQPGPVQERMAFILRTAQENINHHSGGPFAAGVFELESGRLVAVGVNLVPTLQLSILHAEIMAIALAQARLKTYDLGALGLPAHELVTSTEPCAMCFGAIPWSGVKRVVTGATSQDAIAIGFDEGPKPDAWVEALQSRGISVIEAVQQAEAVAILQNYARQGGEIYNARAAADL